MNFELKKVTWDPENMPGTPQTLSLSFRKADAADEAISYTLVTDDLYVLSSGVVVNPPVIKGLENQTDYVFRLTNASSGDTLNVAYSTPNELICPKVSKWYPPNSRIDYVQEDADFFAGMVPTGLAFYSLENDFKDLTGNRGNLGSQTDSVILKKADGYTGAYLDCKTYGLNTDILMKDILGGNSSGAYGLGAYFYVSAEDLNTTGKWPLFSCLDGNGYGVIVYVDNATKEIVWQQKNATLTETVRSTQQILVDSWNNLLVGSFTAVAGNLLQNYLFLNGVGGSSGAITAASIPATFDIYSILYIGASGYYDASLSGKGIFRNVFVSNALSAFTNNGNFSALTHPVGYLTNRYMPFNTITIPHENLIEVSKTKVSFTIPADVPGGTYDFYVGYNGKTTVPAYVLILPVNGSYEEFDFDFADSSGAINSFQYSFNAVGESEGSADGGVTPKNIYFKDNLLVLEAHGDLYDGQVNGVNLDGAPKLHTNSLDMLYGEKWRTRVGAAVATRGYYGYGSYVVEAKLPTQLGVSAFFGLFHDAKVKFQDPYYEQCLNSGLHSQGDLFSSDGIYTVVRNEFAMELPAIASLALYYDFDGLLSNPIETPYAGMKVTVRSIDAADNGIFQLDVPSAPNDRQSWSKVSEDFQAFSQPSKDQVLLRNAKGEIGRGIGIMTDGPEEFLEMHASIGKDVWDDEYHQFRMDWYADRVEYYIDGTLIQTNTHFVPDIIARFSFGMKFPTTPLTQSPWLPDPAKSTIGTSTWHHQAMTVKRTAFTPFTDAVAGGTLKRIAETDPVGKLYSFPLLVP